MERTRNTASMLICHHFANSRWHFPDLGLRSRRGPIYRRELPGRIVMTIGLAMSLSCVALILVLIAS